MSTSPERGVCVVPDRAVSPVSQHGVCAGPHLGWSVTLPARTGI
ncbi:hypothetical protein ABT160_37685 [Streptomyces sp. NPDC001941]